MKLSEELEKPLWLQQQFDPTTFLYQYRCKLVRFVDADTLYALVDTGFNSWMTGPYSDKLGFLGTQIRFARINAWESRGAERLKGLAAKYYCQSLLKPNDEFRIFTYRDRTGKYGRLLADIVLKDANSSMFCLNDHLVALGHARYQAY